MIVRLPGTALRLEDVSAVYCHDTPSSDGILQDRRAPYGIVALLRSGKKVYVWFPTYEDRESSFEQLVENLLKTCEVPVDARFRPRTIGTHDSAAPIPVQTVQSPDLTGQVRSDRTGTDLKITGQKEPTAAILEPTLVLGPHGDSPFPTFGLTDAQGLALRGIVAFWRCCRTSSAPMTHDEFREALWAALAPILDTEGNPSRDDVMREAWDPDFWKSRPELKTTRLTVAPADVIVAVGGV